MKKVFIILLPLIARLSPIYAKKLEIQGADGKPGTNGSITVGRENV
jgi:hypothetical protein